MDVEKLKETVLRDLRSVILSCKGGVPLSRLQNDYKLLIGTTIPFTNLGFKSLETFLQSIPQVVRLKKNSDGTIIEAVADSSTAHLQNLISKQKNTKTPKCSVKRYGKRPTPKQKSSSCPNCAAAKSAFPNSTGGASTASSSWSIASEVSNEKDKEIAALKSKLAEQKEMNIILKSRVNQLLSENEPQLEDEQIMIQRVKYQIGLLQRRILLRHSASPQALKVNRKINEIVERVDDLDTIVGKLSPNSTKVNSSDESAQQFPKYDPFKLYQQQCKETEELKKQVQLQNSQIQSIERRMQSQLQKLQNQIQTDSPSTSSKEQPKSELLEDLMNQMQEQSVQMQNIEKNMASEFLQLKNRVEKEYFVHLVGESEKLKEFEKQLKSQKAQLLNVGSGMQSNIQKLKNKVDSINLKNLADMLVKQLVSGNFVNIPRVVSTSNNVERNIPPHLVVPEVVSTSNNVEHNIPPHLVVPKVESTSNNVELYIPPDLRMLQMLNLSTSSSTTGATPKRKKRRKKSKSSQIPVITIS